MVMMKMKASVKFRGSAEGGQPQNPLLKAKVPVSLLGFPIYTGLCVGHTHELALRLGTSLQEAGHCFEVSYRPNNPRRPLSLTLRACLGPRRGNSAALYMAADFNLSNPTQPAFRLCIKPRLGDFSFQRYFRSPSHNASDLELENEESRSELAFTNFFARSPMAEKRDMPPYSENQNVWADVHDRRRSFTEGSELSNIGNQRRIFSEESEPINAGIDRRIIFKEDRQSAIGEDWEHVKDRMSSSRSSSIASQQAGHQGNLQLVPGTVSNVSKGWDINSLLGGGHLRVHSSLSLPNQARLKVRWCMRSPITISVSPFRIPLLPLLGLDKVSFEGVGTPFIIQGSHSLSFFRSHESDLKEQQFYFKDRLHSMQLENNLLMKALESIKRDAQISCSECKTEEKPTVDHPSDEAEVKKFLYLRKSFNGESPLN